MKVYVVNKHKRPLMPTTPRKARILLKKGLAKIFYREPFTIQMIYGTSGYTQPASLGIDSGYSHIGLSAVNGKEELLGGEVKLLEGMSERLSERARYRRIRRNRLRYQGTTQLRCEPLMMEQIRRNKRSLSQFYDAKYIDVRDLCFTHKS